MVAGRVIQSGRDVLGSALGRLGEAALAVSPALHRRYSRLVTRGPARKLIGHRLMAHVEAIRTGAPPLEVLRELADELRAGIARGDFDQWIERPKSLARNSKRTLVRCDNYLPGRRWKLQIFYLVEGQSHPPHSHDDMASALVVARGKVEAREYHRVRGLETDDQTIMLEQSSEGVLSEGGGLLTSDDHNNVHWFGAVGGPAVAFNFQVVGLARGKRPSEKLRSYVDPVQAPDAVGPLPARRIGIAEAHAKFSNAPPSAFQGLRSAKEKSARAATARMAHLMPRSREKLPVLESTTALTGITTKNRPTESSRPACSPATRHPITAKATHRSE